MGSSTVSHASRPAMMYEYPAMNEISTPNTMPNTANAFTAPFHPRFRHTTYARMETPSSITNTNSVKMPLVGCESAFMIRSGCDRCSTEASDPIARNTMDAIPTTNPSCFDFLVNSFNPTKKNVHPAKPVSRVKTARGHWISITHQPLPHSTCRGTRCSPATRSTCRKAGRPSKARCRSLSIDARHRLRGNRLARIRFRIVQIAVEATLDRAHLHALRLLAGRREMRHNVHFSTTLSALFQSRTPYGQAIMQYLQPMHFSLSTSTTLVSGSR